MKIHTGQNKYFCSICGKGCTTPALLDKHIMEHSIEKNNSGEKKNCSNSFMCNVMIDNLLVFLIMTEYF
jgi:hypothetical protein